ncbi:hypothetical protein DFH09DRAFT_1086934 [Mycena vulgaris]|nr:hypothetical protein DFH09DRAFT_1086934 [Mycena vulgaris]
MTYQDNTDRAIPRFILSEEVPICKKRERGGRRLPNTRVNAGNLEAEYACRSRSLIIKHVLANGVAARRNSRRQQRDILKVVIEKHQKEVYDTDVPVPLRITAPTRAFSMTRVVLMYLARSYRSRHSNSEVGTLGPMHGVVESGEDLYRHCDRGGRGLDNKSDLERVRQATWAQDGANGGCGRISMTEVVIVLKLELKKAPPGSARVTDREGKRRIGGKVSWVHPRIQIRGIQAGLLDSRVVSEEAATRRQWLVP